ncbi:MAG: hypothetical protein Q8L48_04975 [Archangium sp.]|nr:hypothetical protein [Archangium sp.]
MFEAVLPATPAVCFAEFIDLRSARLWLPGLKKARVVRSDEQGRPLEVSYEFGDILSYALVYAYDDAQLRVRWVPSAGLQDGVSGSASFDAAPGGCVFRYSLESLRGRAPTHEHDVAQAFTAWITSRRAT